MSSWLQSSSLLGEQEKKGHIEHGATSLLSSPCQGTGLLLIHAVGFLHSFFGGANTIFLSYFLIAISVSVVLKMFWGFFL